MELRELIFLTELKNNQQICFQGSFALQQYGLLKHRNINDIDFLFINSVQFDISKNIASIINLVLKYGYKTIKHDSIYKFISKNSVPFECIFAKNIDLDDTIIINGARVLKIDILFATKLCQLLNLKLKEHNYGVDISTKFNNTIQDLKAIYNNFTLNLKDIEFCFFKTIIMNLSFDLFNTDKSYIKFWNAVIDNLKCENWLVKIFEFIYQSNHWNKVNEVIEFAYKLKNDVIVFFDEYKPLKEILKFYRLGSYLIFYNANFCHNFVNFIKNKFKDHNLFNFKFVLNKLKKKTIINVIDMLNFNLK